MSSISAISFEQKVPVEAPLHIAIYQTLRKISMLISYLLAVIVSALEAGTRKELFQGKIIATAQNNGKLEEIGRYLHPAVIPELQKRGDDRQLHLKTDEVAPDPFGPGGCFGATLLFAERYLFTKDVEATAKLFVGGMPYEAYLLQSCYVLYNEHAQLPQDMADEEYHTAVRQASASLIGMRATEYACNATPDHVLEMIPDLMEGVYQLSFPCYDPVGALVGWHACLLIKESAEGYYLFDPSRGTGVSDDGKELATRLFRSWNGYGNTNSRLTNFFLSQASPPKEAMDQSFKLYRLDIAV